jgi:hypothetical protein
MSAKYDDLLIFYDNSIEYFRTHFERKGLRTVNIYKEVSIFSKIIRVIFRYFGFRQEYWYGDWKKSLSSRKTVIFFAPEKRTCAVRYIKKTNKNIRIIYWYWNPAFRSGIPSSHLSNTTELWSFDPDDCLKYNMRFNTTFFFDDILLPSNKIEFDAVFIGINKGRKDSLNKLESDLNRSGLRTYFHIVADKNESSQKNCREIPYEEYLGLVSKAKAIVDVKPIGQSGLTLRPMESTFFKKKLITNDVSIMSQDFYHPENIFIIGRDNKQYLKKFIDSPFKELDPSIVKNYDVSSWVERFSVK